MKRSLEADVVAVGAGFGGLVCALTAHDAGLSALVVEKSSRLGGVTAMSAGQVWVPASHVAKAAGIDDSWQEGANYIERIGAGTADRTRLESLLISAVEALEYVEDSTDLTWNLVSLADYYAGTTDHGRAYGRYVEAGPLSAAHLGVWQHRSRRGTLYPDRMTSEETLRWRRDGVVPDADTQRTREAEDVRCGGSAIAVALISALVDRGVPIVTGVATTQLTRDPATGRVDGLEALVDGHPVHITAHKGVLLATGGYDRNLDLVRRLDRLDRYGTVSHAGITGDSLQLAGQCGAQTASNAKPFQLGFNVPGEQDEEGAESWRVVSMQPHSILVNREGRRFADEAHYVSYSAAVQLVDGRVQERPNLPVYLICDSRYRSTYGIGGLSQEDPLPDAVVESQGLRELAAALGIAGDSLEATVERFNQAAATGRDDEFHRGETPFERHSLPSGSTAANTLGSITEPPFFGVRLDPVGMGLANTGLVGDTHGRVLNWQGDPIDGLYAAGNSLAMMEIGSGYQSGFANMRGMTHGYLAARHMAATPAGSSRVGLS